MHGHRFLVQEGKKEKHKFHFVFKQGLHKEKTCVILIILFMPENVAKTQCVDVPARSLDKDTVAMLNAPNDALAGALKQQHPMGPIVWEQTPHE
jgi:hypothetical protein